MSLEEATISNMWEIAAIVEVLERKGLCTKQDLYGIIEELRSKNTSVDRVRAVEDQIEKVEGFVVIITDRCTNKRYPDKAELPLYPYRKRAPNNMAVNDWINERFTKTYPDSAVKTCVGGIELTGGELLGDLRDQ